MLRLVLLNATLAISIHTPLAGSDCRVRCFRAYGSDISIHTPLAGSDAIMTTPGFTDSIFQSTLPLRGATVVEFTDTTERGDFNPHSPCGERPFQSSNLPDRTPSISIHTPLAGSDRGRLGCGHIPGHFNPHSPCGERPDCRAVFDHLRNHFNPHSPCGERRYLFSPFTGSMLFQSTLPLRGATRRPDQLQRG